MSRYVIHFACYFMTIVTWARLWPETAFCGGVAPRGWLLQVLLFSAVSALLPTFFGRSDNGPR